MNEESKAEERKFKCEHCNQAEFDSPQQLRGHQMKCRPKEDSQEKVEYPRQKRVPFGLPRQRFGDVPKDDGFHYRVFNDKWRKDPGRVQRAIAAGYERVDHPQSNKTVGTNDDNTEIKGVLMRIPQELWEQDQAMKEESRAIVDEQIHRGLHTAAQGDGRYVPGGGTRMESKLTP